MLAARGWKVLCFAFEYPSNRETTTPPSQSIHREVAVGSQSVAAFKSLIPWTTYEWEWTSSTQGRTPSGCTRWWRWHLREGLRFRAMRKERSCTLTRPSVNICIMPVSKALKYMCRLSAGTKTAKCNGKPRKEGPIAGSNDLFFSERVAGEEVPNTNIPYYLPWQVLFARVLRSLKLIRSTRLGCMSVVRRGHGVETLSSMTNGKYKISYQEA